MFQIRPTNFVVEELVKFNYIAMIYIVFNFIFEEYYLLPYISVVCLVLFSLKLER